MGIWSRLFRRRDPTPAAAARETEPEEPPAPETGNTLELPVEPFVFECQSCGKVFEARRKKPLCPECDSPDVAIVSE